MIHRTILILTIAVAPGLTAQQVGSDARSVVSTTAVASGAAARTVASGIAGQLSFEAPRIAAGAADITLDGILNEGPWERATLLNGFSQFQPVDGLPAEDSTQVLVWYSSTAMYFGIRAFESHGSPRATRASRDKIFSDDKVEILIDTFNDRRRAMSFGVNPFGVQSDGNLVEGLQTRATAGRTRTLAVGRDTADLSADFVFQSKGRVTDYGFEVEIRIPFKSLPYQPLATQTWGINVIRQVQHSGRENTWTPAKKASNSFLAQGGRLAGLTGLSRGLVLDAVPEITSKVTGSRANAASAWNYDTQRPKVGGSVRWGVTNNLTLSGTANPDFSQVEADAERVQSDPRRTTSYAEKRPFFLEGIDQFQVGNALIYSRRVVAPVFAAKLAGKVGTTNVGFLSAVDTRLQSASGTVHPLYNILRVRRDIGKQSTVGLTYTDRIEGGNYNRVGSVDGRIAFAKVFGFRFQTAGSINHVGSGNTIGPMWDVALERAGRRFTSRYSFNGFSPKFVAGSGLIGRSNSANLAFSHGFTWFGKPGSKIESFTWNFPLTSTWNYRRMVEGFGGDYKNDNSWTLVLRRGWRFSFSYFLETFKYDPDLYATYAIERHQGAVVDTVPFVGTDRLTNHDLGWGFQTPQFKKMDASGSVFTGWDENFSEWSRAWYWNITGTINFRPTDKLRLNANLQRREYQRLTDRTKVLTRTVPYLKAEYQVSRPVFFRIVAQYDIQWRDSLRDDSRTGQPLLIRNAAGVYRKAGITRTNDLRFDVLFSYQPNPGTVFFAGYGSSLTETLPLRFDDMKRTQDGFFIKLSYLFRM